MLVFSIVNIMLITLLKQQHVVIEEIKRYEWLIAVYIFLTCFAVSNVVTFNDAILVSIPFPEFLINICGIFRASSRMSYPVYYTIFLFMAILLWKMLENRRQYACGVLLFIVILQVFDLHECIIQKHKDMGEKQFYTSFVNEDLKLKEIAKNADCVLFEKYNENNRTLSVWAFKNNLSTYFTVANSGSYDKTANLANEMLFQIKENRNLGRNIIVTTNMNVARLYRQFMNCRIYETEGKYFIYDTGIGTQIKATDGGIFETSLNELMWQLANLTDRNWSKGYSNTQNILLFNRQDKLLWELFKTRKIVCNNTVYYIQNIDWDELWIRVTVDRDASECMYPAEIKIE